MRRNRLQCGSVDLFDGCCFKWRVTCSVSGACVCVLRQAGHGVGPNARQALRPQRPRMENATKEKTHCSTHEKGSMCRGVVSTPHVCCAADVKRQGAPQVPRVCGGMVHCRGARHRPQQGRRSAHTTHACKRARAHSPKYLVLSSMHVQHALDLSLSRFGSRLQLRKARDVGSTVRCFLS